jgi:AcrR family transcriptional regulator
VNSSTEKIRAKKKRFLEREERIVEAARRLFLENGVDNVTVSHIAQRAGIGKGTVYKHFESKAQIMVRIMLDYEKRICANLEKGIDATLNGDPGAAARAYFQSRLGNPELDRLVQHLEARLEGEPEVEGEMRQLHDVRRSTIESLNTMVKELIRRNILEDVPPHYHYLACWALAQGAVEVCFNKGYADQFDDKESLLDFISRIGVTMGNRGQLRRQ